MRKFLTAQWLDLFMANYRVEPSVLAPFVPTGTELDFWNGETYVSLVAFKFFNTRVLGMPVPFHTNFLEVNLRFYVRRAEKRGVVFIKEIVPRFAISLVARTLYGEPYETWKMRCLHVENDLTYAWSKAGLFNEINVKFKSDKGVPADNSHESFIIEHYWGYTRRGPARTDEYKVEHPKWSLWETGDAKIDVDFGAVYGREFDFLINSEPVSTLLAKGSEISVYKGEKIAGA
jgi:uncharacterized protein